MGIDPGESDAQGAQHQEAGTTTAPLTFCILCPRSHELEEDRKHGECGLSRRRGSRDLSNVW